MLEAILSFGQSSILGGVVGLVGSWLTKREERKQQDQEFRHEQRMAEINTEQMRFRATHELQLANKEIDRTEVEGELSAFRESLKTMAAKTGIPIVDALRAIMRPVVTVYLLGLSSYVAFKVAVLVGGLSNIDTAVIEQLFVSIVRDTLFLTNVAVTWWFGSRPSSSRYTNRS